METLNLTVGGMSCMGCVTSIKKMLLALPGVKQVEVTLTDGHVFVGYDSSKLNPEAVKVALEDAGYEVKK